MRILNSIIQGITETLSLFFYFLPKDYQQKNTFCYHFESNKKEHFQTLNVLLTYELDRFNKLVIKRLIDLHMTIKNNTISYEISN